MAKVKVGVIGLGMMGYTHLDAYAENPDVEVVALADKDEKRLSGEDRPGGNIEGQAQGGFDFDAVRKYEDGMDLINDPDVDVVDICVVTPLHLRFCEAAFKAGKHVLVEKPLARTYEDSLKVAELAKNSGKIAMPAMCMRFWPGWTWLKDVVDSKCYGKVLSASFRRVASHPGGPFYKNGEASGGAALDLHIHDTDFVQFLFGTPKAVSSVGYSSISGAPDHMLTQYHYEGIGMVTAEGGWAMQEGFPFTMQYTVNFEKATAVFDLAADSPLRVIVEGKPAEAVEIPSKLGYAGEIEYFIECVKTGAAPTTVTLEDAANAVRIIEAEVESIQSGQKVML